MGKRHDVSEGLPRIHLKRPNPPLMRLRAEEGKSSSEFAKFGMSARLIFTVS
jgi:hypothetical protein